jgi:L-ascorbate metabolism protein UlaG (beta-lactamase superfamily)
MVEVTWFGHACVGLQHGRDRLVMDPFGPDIGLTPLATTADIVTVSHDNPRWHSNTAGVGGDPQVRLHGLKLARTPVTALGMRLTAQVVGEDLDRGGAPNAMVKVQVGGVTFVHFGDLGHAIEPREGRFVADADVWFALAGGSPTIPLPLLVEAWRRYRPRVMIPVHYRTPSMTSFGTLDDLLQLLPESAVKRRGDSVVHCSADTLPDEPEVWLLDPLCDPQVAAAAAG